MADSFGAELRKRRKTAGLTQVEVAERLGLSRPTITQWEVGRHRPSSEHLTRLDHIYNARGALVGLGQQHSVETPQQARHTFVADIFRCVADALVERLRTDENGAPLGWSHDLFTGRATALSTAYAIRTLQLLDDARVDLRAIGQLLWSRRQKDGWTNRRQSAARPETTAVVLAALVRLGVIDDVERELELLKKTVGDYSMRRSFVLSVVLETVLALRPSDPFVDDLVRALLDCRIPHGDRMLWTLDSSVSPELTQPSLAHTARSTAILRLVRETRPALDVTPAIDDAIEWMIELGAPDEGTIEILRSMTDDRMAVIPIQHFTSAWTIRAMCGVEGVPTPRLDAAFDVFWEGYAPEHGLWVWRLDGSVPSWMTYDAVSCLRFVAAQGLSTPVTASEHRE